MIHPGVNTGVVAASSLDGERILARSSRARGWVRRAVRRELVYDGVLPVDYTQPVRQCPVLPGDGALDDRKPIGNGAGPTVLIPEMVKSDRVLLVDDSAAARVRLKHALVQGGFDVSEASDGVEGLYRARQETFQLIMTDIHMPMMDGLAFIRELRKMPEYAQTPIIVLTSDFSKDRMAQVRLAGATVWIEKPPNLTTVASLVRATIK
jgi:two-component system chemotaxis response regulator CheY